MNGEYIPACDEMSDDEFNSLDALDIDLILADEAMDEHLLTLALQRMAMEETHVQEILNGARA